jgi:hypothetical protein
MTKKCLYCDEDISNFASNKIICNSILCLRKRDIEVRKLPKLNKNCIYCGIDISNLRRDSKFCKSLACRNKNSIETYKTRLKDKVCLYCNKIFKGNDKKFQCPECTNQRYKSTKTHRVIIRRELYLKWTKQIMMRDNFRCKECNTHSNLEVHHIIPLRDITNNVLSQFKITNLFLIDINSNLFREVLDSILKAHSLDIGITLCKVCHSKVDNKRHVKIQPS